MRLAIGKCKLELKLSEEIHLFWESLMCSLRAVVQLIWILGETILLPQVELKVQDQPQHRKMIHIQEVEWLRTVTTLALLKLSTLK